MGRPPISLGASWHEFLPGAQPRKRPTPSAPLSEKERWYDFLPGGKARGKAPSIFDVFTKGAPQEPEAPEREGFFKRIFKRKGRVEVSPIPPEERRETRPLPGLPSPEEVPTGPLAEQPVILPEVQTEITAVQESAPPPQSLFDILTPEPPPPALETQAELPGALIMPEAQLPATADPFSVLEPQELSTAGPFDPFSVLPEAPAGGLVVRPPQEAVISSVFDILEPGAALAPYVPPPPRAEEPPPPPPRAPGPPPPAPTPAVRKARKKKWHPTREEWIRWIEETFNLNELFQAIREERDSEFFIELQTNYEDTGEAPTIPIETWVDASMFDQIFRFFGMPDEVWEPYADAIAKEEEKEGYSDEGWEDMQTEVIMPLSAMLEAAFKALQPPDLPGFFILGPDSTSEQWGLVYYEEMKPEELAVRGKEAKAARKRQEEERKALERHRAQEVKRIWGSPPDPEDLVPWIEEKYDVDAMFRDIAQMRKRKSFQKNMKEFGQETVQLEVIVDIGQRRTKEYEYEIASYFGIPPDIVSLYEESDSSQELWEDIFWPFFRNLSEAFSMLLPYAELPGMILVDEDDNDQLVIQYQEEEEA